MKEKLKALILHSIFLNEVEKAAWLKKIDELGAVEQEGLLRIFKAQEAGLKKELKKMAAEDPEHKVMKVLSEHFRLTNQGLAHHVHSADEEEAEADLDESLKQL